MKLTDKKEKNMFSKFVFGLIFVYVLHYVAMIAIDYYKAVKRTKNNKAEEDIDISRAVGQYKPVKKSIAQYEPTEADDDINYEDDQNESETDDELWNEETVPVNYIGGKSYVDMKKIVIENSGENFFEKIMEINA